MRILKRLYALYKVIKKLGGIHFVIFRCTTERDWFDNKLNGDKKGTE